MWRSAFVLIVLVVSLALVLAACTTADDDEAAEAAGDAVAEVADDASEDAAETDDATDDAEVDVETTDGETDNGFPADMDEVAELLASEGFALCSDEEAVEAAGTLSPELDLASLEAQSFDRTFEAETYDHTYVGDITDDLLIGISLDSRYVDQAGGVAVYLCDSEDISIYLTGEIEDGSAVLSDDDVEVELEIADEEIGGTVALAGEEAQSFSANAATDGAGMYVATDVAGDIDLEVRWVVASDGRQRGRVVCCWPTSHITFACGCCLQQR